MRLSQTLSHFQGQINLVENILAVRETPGAQPHILNNTPIRFEGFCSSTFEDMLATNLDGRTDVRTDVRTIANLYAPPIWGHKTATFLLAPYMKI